MTASRRYLVTVLEWLSHEVLIEAESPAAAEVEARRRWDEALGGFKLRGNGIDGVEVVELDT